MMKTCSNIHWQWLRAVKGIRFKVYHSQLLSWKKWFSFLIIVFIVWLNVVDTFAVKYFMHSNETSDNNNDTRERIKWRYAFVSWKYVQHLSYFIKWQLLKWHAFEIECLNNFFLFFNNVFIIWTYGFMLSNSFCD